MTLAPLVALDGVRPAHVTDRSFPRGSAENKAAPIIAEGRLVQALADWCAPFPGYHLYYPSRRQTTLAFQLVVDTQRRRT
ncbi:hypothetical protein OCOJLMKI_5184 [Methylobacterium iners]|uniref:Uncharacterized protein n=1 Tax=Methylobacterium iners TaxID=418707 RepID=A0ABQ4S5V6_9HYPH|nr:hypothetical protein OCOJLMKI_5184 [Methylobacterium iners]